MTPDRTAAAIEARRRAAEQKLQQVRDAIASIRRHKAPVTYPAVARQAGVSRTFLYANPDARALISQAVLPGRPVTRPFRGTAGRYPRRPVLPYVASGRSKRMQLTQGAERPTIMSGHGSIYRRCGSIDPVTEL